MKKSLFQTFMPAELLAKLISLDSDEERGKFAVRFALDLMADDEKKASSTLAKETITATKRFRERKSASGKKGMSKRWNKNVPKNSNLDNNAITHDNSVITKVKVKVNKDKVFVPPTPEEVDEYCQQRNNDIDGKYFVDFYSAGDWIKANGQPVKNWKQTVIYWENNGMGKAPHGKKSTTGGINQWGS